MIVDAASLFLPISTIAKLDPSRRIAQVEPRRSRRVISGFHTGAPTKKCPPGTKALALTTNRRSLVISQLALLNAPAIQLEHIPEAKERAPKERTRKARGTASRLAPNADREIKWK